MSFGANDLLAQLPASCTTLGRGGITMQSIDQSGEVERHRDGAMEREWQELAHCLACRRPSGQGRRAQPSCRQGTGSLPATELGTRVTRGKTSIPQRTIWESKIIFNRWHKETTDYTTIFEAAAATPEDRCAVQIPGRHSDMLMISPTRSHLSVPLGWFTSLVIKETNTRAYNKH